MADTTDTTYISELCVPLSALMIAAGEDPYSLNNFADIYEAANRMQIRMEETDRNWWQSKTGKTLTKEHNDLLRRTIQAGSDIFYNVYGGRQGQYEAALIGRENSSDWPPDFRINTEYFSLKDNSNILWNTTPKVLLQYINPQLWSDIITGKLDYLQGKPLYSKGKQSAYDWYLFADSDLSQQTYSKFFNAWLKLMYDIKMYYQPQWDPHEGKDEWWYEDSEGYRYPKVSSNNPVVGNSGKPNNYSPRIVWSEEFAGHYGMCIYDGFDEEDYETSFVALYDTRGGTIGIIPIVFYDEGNPVPYFDPFTGHGRIDIIFTSITQRYNDAVGEWDPPYEFSISTNGVRKPLTQQNAKVISRFCTSCSEWSPIAKNFTPKVNLNSFQMLPVENYENYYSELSGTCMTEIEYWLKRTKMNASDAFAFAVQDIIEDINETELLCMLLRIADRPYYYVRMYNNGTEILRVPTKNEFAAKGISIQTINFDPNRENTMLALSAGSNPNNIVELEIEFRNKAGYFSGAPDMNVIYNERNSNLGSVYDLV